MAGSVHAGDQYAKEAGQAEGANQNTDVLILRETSNQEDYIYDCSPAFLNAVLIGPEVKKTDVSTDVDVRKYRKEFGNREGLFGHKRTGRVSVLSASRAPFAIAIPLTINLGDGTTIDGSMNVDVNLDLSTCESAQLLSAMLYTDYASISNTGTMHTRSINPNGIMIHLRNHLAGSVEIEMDTIESVFKRLAEVRQRIFNALHTNPAFKNRGVRISLVNNIRFTEDASRKIERLITEERIELEEKRVAFNNRMAELNMAIEEYDLVNGRDPLGQ